VEAGEGGGFVGEAWDGLDQAGQLEDFEDVAGGVANFESAAEAADSDEAADDGADAGAIDLRNAVKVDDDLACAAFDERAQLRAQLVVAAADGGASLEIDDGDISRLAAGNLQSQAKLLGPTSAK